nr:hypothetical protein [Variovorax dokdonensis]
METPFLPPVLDDSLASASKLQALFGRARRFKDAGDAKPAPLLKGAHVALVRPPGWDEARSALHAAIEALGGKAVLIRFDETDAVAKQELHAIARLFGRLYGAMDCMALSPSTVRALAEQSGIPVFCGLGCGCHPLHGLGELWTIEQALEGEKAPRRIDFIGDATAQPAAAFLRAARARGFDLRLSRRAVRGAKTSVCVDARRPVWALHMGTRTIDAATRTSNCAHLIEAVLAEAITRA